MYTCLWIKLGLDLHIGLGIGVRVHVGLGLGERVGFGLVVGSSCICPGASLS